MKTIIKVFICLLFFNFLLPISTAHAFLGLFGDGNISLVKEGFLPHDRSITIGQAFENNKSLSEVLWENIEDEQGRAWVRFTAKINPHTIELEERETYLLQAFELDSVFKPLSEDLKIVVDFLIFPEDDTFAMAPVKLLINGFSSDAKGFHLEEFHVERALTELYSNKMPFYSSICSIMDRCVVIDLLKKDTENLNQTFYQLSVNSLFAKEKSSDYNLFSKSLYWTNKGVDTSSTYFKIKELTYDTITFDAVFFMEAPNSRKHEASMYTYTFEDVVLPIVRQDYTYGKLNKYRIIAEDGNGLQIIVQREALFNDILTASINYHKKIDGLDHSSSSNKFICNEKAKTDSNIIYEALLGVLIAPPNNEGFIKFIDEHGSERDLDARNVGVSYLDEKHIGVAYHLIILDDSIMRLDSTNEYKYPSASIEGNYFEIIANSRNVIFQDTNGNQYEIIAINNPNILIAGTRFVPEKGYVKVGQDGKIINRVWRIDAEVRWYYDKETNSVKKGNFATHMTSAYEPVGAPISNNNILIPINIQNSQNQNILPETSSSIENNEQKELYADEYSEEFEYPFKHEDSSISGGIALEYFEMNAFNLFLETVGQGSSIWTCGFSAQCTENNGNFICEDSEAGNVEGTITYTSITITSAPTGFCGINGSMLGKYVYTE